MNIEAETGYILQTADYYPHILDHSVDEYLENKIDLMRLSEPDFFIAADFLGLEPQVVVESAFKLHFQQPTIRQTEVDYIATKYTKYSGIVVRRIRKIGKFDQDQPSYHSVEGATSSLQIVALDTNSPRLKTIVDRLSKEYIKQISEKGPYQWL